MFPVALWITRTGGQNLIQFGNQMLDLRRRNIELENLFFWLEVCCIVEVSIISAS